MDRERKWRRPGIVYKSGQFWQEHPHFGTGRAVFDGKAAVLTSSLPGLSDFQEAFLAYLTGYYDSCYESDLKFRRDVKDYRYKIGKDSSYSEIVMDERFAPYFVQYFEAHRARVGLSVFEVFARALEKSPSDRNALVTILFEVIAGKLASGAGWKMFFAKAQCRSATMKQMTENLLLAAKHQGSLQSSGISIPGVERETDPVTAADVNVPPLRRRSHPAGRRHRSQESAARSGDTQCIPADPLRGLVLIYKEQSLAALVHKLDQDGASVLRCNYSPVGASKNGDPKYDIYSFWYRSVPSEARHAFAVDTNKRIRPGLRFAVSACPATGREAEALALSQ